MAMGTGLLALAILAAGGPASPQGDTQVNVKVLTLDGLGWRSESYGRLQQVGRQGTSTIWTADRALAASLVKRAGKSISFPMVTGIGGATLSRTEALHYVAAIDRVADGPINQSSALAFLPRPDKIELGFATKVTGRWLDQGYLAKLTLDEACVDAVHLVPQTETIRPAAEKTARTPTDVGREILNVVMSKDADKPGRTISSSVQVPEVSVCRIDGEWLIPTDGALIVSLCVKTGADEKGMAVVRERVAVIEVDPILGWPSSQHTQAEVGSPAPFQYARLPMPATPSRSMPEPLDTNGNLVDLPPLPEAVASADLDRIKPAPNQPSPQSPVVPSPSFVPDRDTELARTSFDAENPIPLSPFLVSNSDPRTRRLLERAIEALEKASVDLDSNAVQVDFKELQPTQGGCEKCDIDEKECPFSATSPSPAGGLKLATEMASPAAIQVNKLEGSRNLAITASLDDALKTPGRTETKFIPLGGKLALEIKVTVVPAKVEKPKAADKSEDWCGTAVNSEEMSKMLEEDAQFWKKQQAKTPASTR